MAPRSSATTAFQIKSQAHLFRQSFAPDLPRWRSSHACLANEHRVFLVRRHRIWMTRMISLSARSPGPACLHGQRWSGRASIFPAFGSGFQPGGRSPAAHAHLQHGFVDPVARQTGAFQQARRRRAPLVQNRQEDMLVEIYSSFRRLASSFARSMIRFTRG